MLEVQSILNLVLKVSIAIVQLHLNWIHLLFPARPADRVGVPGGEAARERLGPHVQNVGDGSDRNRQLCQQGKVVGMSMPSLSQSANSRTIISLLQCFALALFTENMPIP